MRDVPGANRGEYAISLASTLKGMGLGRAVLGTVLQAAAEIGITEIWGTVARRNHGMRRLAEKLGMKERADADDPRSVITEITLTRPHP